MNESDKVSNTRCAMCGGKLDWSKVNFFDPGSSGPECENGCHDNQPRPISVTSKTTLSEIVSRLPEKHVAREEYARLVDGNIWIEGPELHCEIQDGKLVPSASPDDKPPVVATLSGRCPVCGGETIEVVSDAESVSGACPCGFEAITAVDPGGKEGIMRVFSICPVQDKEE